MKQKMFCLGDDYLVKDEGGKDAYYIDGKVFTIRKTLEVQDMAGTTLATIRRRLISLGATYDIIRGKTTTVVHKHLFTLFHCTFSVDVPGPDDLEAKGNFLDYEYDFKTAGGERVAEVSKRWIALKDTYTIDVAAGQDPVLIIAAAVVIDQCCHEEKD